MAERPLPRLLRSGLGGLALGLTGAGAVLAVKAVLTMRVDCGALTLEECDFARDIAASVAKLQGLTALGCFLVGLGLALALRKRGQEHGEGP